MRETTRHRLAFAAYVDMGPSRTLEALQARIKANPVAFGLARAPGLRSLYRWSSELHWQDRLDDLEREARRQDAESYIRSLKEMNERQAREGLVLQQKAVQRIQALADDELTGSEAIRALVEGARLERLARGEVTDRSQIERTDDLDLSGFSIAELRVLAQIAANNSRGDRTQESE
ncbi:MAG: hypothetical protein AB7V46_15025 [Thermomicrobiales bacterium]